MGEPHEEVTVSADGYEPASGRRLTVVELARTQGVRPVSSVEELAQDDGFSSDAEVDEFIAFVRAMRHADTA
jgi:hypothetical protein